MSLDSKLVNVQGKLIDIARQVDLSTVQHAREIQKDRLNDKDLRDMWFWTADFPLYIVEKGEVVLYIAGRENNLLFQNLNTAVKQLREENNYFPNDSDIGVVINAKSTLRVKLSDLKLQCSDNELSYFEINTNNYSELNKSQKALAGRVHGEGKAFDSVMKMLSDSGIQKSKIYVLNPDYVKNTLQQRNSKSLARGSFLNNFYGNSNFLADLRSVGNNLRRLRGVRLAARSAGAQKNDQYKTALDTVLANEQEVLKLMHASPVYAQKLNALIGKYISSKT